MNAVGSRMSKRQKLDEGKTVTCFDSLPDDLVRHVLTFSDVTGIFYFRLVSRVHPKNVRVVLRNLRRVVVTHRNGKIAAERCKKLEVVTHTFGPHRVEHLMKIVRSNPRITDLSIPGHDGLLETLAAVNLSLQKLHLQIGCMKSVLRIHTSMLPESLKTLNIQVKIVNLGVVCESCPNLEEFEYFKGVPPGFLKHLAIACKNLRTLRLRVPQNEECHLVHFKNVKELFLSRMLVNSGHIRSLSQFFGNLTYLGFSFMFSGDNDLDISQECKNLKRLTAGRECSGYLRNCSKLEEFKCRNQIDFRRLEKDGVELPCLKRIVVSEHCTDACYRSLVRMAPNLEEFAFSSKLYGLAELNIIVKGCKKLRKLRLETFRSQQQFLETKKDFFPLEQFNEKMKVGVTNIGWTLIKIL